MNIFPVRRSLTSNMWIEDSYWLQLLRAANPTWLFSTAKPSKGTCARWEDGPPVTKTPLATTHSGSLTFTTWSLRKFALWTVKTSALLDSQSRYNKSSFVCRNIFPNITLAFSLAERSRNIGTSSNIIFKRLHTLGCEATHSRKSPRWNCLTEAQDEVPTGKT